MNDKRCDWGTGIEIYEHYHDHEWGVPVKDDRKLFEFVILEGAQAGLSWLTILRRRYNYRRAFAQFDAEIVSRFTEADQERLRGDAGIIRNRLKIKSAINNAQRFLQVQEDFGSFSNYMWGFVEGKPIQNEFRKMSEIPASTPLSDEISKDMKKRGFTFFGTTICYAHMQATGMVNDHLISCPRHAVCAAMG